MNRLLPLSLLSCLTACAVSEADHKTTAMNDPSTPTEDAGGDAMSRPMPLPDAGDDSEPDASADASLGVGNGCVATKSRATLEKSPVDIIWVVDNSVSMSPAIDQVTSGINAFAQKIAAGELDYRVIMLALRGKGQLMVGSSARYGVCVPAPLAGDNNCGNGARFFQSSVDIKSTQPLEQLLGTLGQTRGFQPGDARGGDPWLDQLRPGATKSIVVVSDDNARLTASDFEHFAGGASPFNSSTDLPPGLLESKWNGAFDGYVFHGIYGWGSESDVNKTCTYPDGSVPPASGATYSTLVAKTHGVRAQICDGADAWAPFFDSVATAVQHTAKIACDLAIPAAPDGSTLDPKKINVSVNVPGAPAIRLHKVASGSCGSEGGWYYDNDAAPKQVTLCPASCDLAQKGAGTDTGGVDVEFGCATVVL